MSVAGTVDSRQVPDLVGDLDLVGEPDMSSLASSRFLSPRFVIVVILMTTHLSAEGINLDLFALLDVLSRSPYRVYSL